LEEDKKKGNSFDKLLFEKRQETPEFIKQFNHKRRNSKNIFNEANISSHGYNDAFGRTPIIELIFEDLRKSFVSIQKKVFSLQQGSSNGNNNNVLMAS